MNIETKNSSIKQKNSYHYSTDDFEIKKESSFPHPTRHRNNERRSLRTPRQDGNILKDYRTDQQNYNANRDNNNKNIVHEILCEQDLSRAGDLFIISNEILLDEFLTTIEIIKNIIDNRSYINNLNEQSIVEIVLTRCISALRESRIIFNYYNDLLDLLKICLKYNLNNSNRFSKNLPLDLSLSMSDTNNNTNHSSSQTNTPHANIISDIFSSILLVF
jgi:hypothetical protein